MSRSSGFDLERFLPYCLNQAAEAASQAFKTTYVDRYGMTRTEWRVLAHLGQFGEMNASEICARASLHKTKVSRAVYSLEKRKWLVRMAEPADRRVDRLILTRSGRKTFEDLGAIALELDRKLQDLLTGQEARCLRSALGKLTLIR